MDERKQKIAGLFNRAAPTYDRRGPQFFSHIGERLVDLAQIPGGARVLDIATGKGANLFPAAKVIGSEGKAIGIDFSEAMVQETTQEILRLQIINAEVHAMDAEELIYESDAFD